MTYTSSKRIFIWILTLLAASHGISLESPWCIVAGILYLIFCIGIVPMVVEDAKADNVPDFIDRCYGGRLRMTVSVVSLLYISFRLGSYTSLIHNHLGLVLNNTSYIPLLLITGIVSFALLFYLEGIIWLQALLFAVFIMVLPFFARENVYLAGNTVSWARWLAKVRVDALQYPLQDAMIYLLPTNLLAGHIFLSSSHKKEIKRACVISVFLSLAFLVLLLFTKVQSVDVKVKYGLVYYSALTAWHIFLISHLLYMGSTFLSHGIIKHILPISSHTGSSSKLASLVVLGWGIVVVAISYYCPDQLFSTLSRHMLPCIIPFQLVFLAGIIGFTPDKKTFYTTVGTSIATYFLSFMLGLGAPKSCIVSIVASIVAFGVTHYSVHQGFSFVKRGWRESKALQAYMSSWTDTKDFIKKLLFFPKYIASLSREKASAYGSQPFKFGLFFGLSSYVFPFFMAPFEAQEACGALALIQYIGFLLSIGLLTYPYWPTFLLHYFPLYWHITLCYCLPLASSLIYLLVGGSNTWLINLAIATMLLARLVGSGSFIIVNIVGIALSIGIGWHIPIAQKTLQLLLQDMNTLYPLLYTYVFSGLVSFFFLRKRYEEQHRTNEILQIFCQKIMHKITNVVGLAKSHATLLVFCKKSMEIMPQKDKVSVLIKIGTSAYEMMDENIKLLNQESTTSQSILKNMTIPIRANIKPNEFKSYSTAVCIKEALQNYDLYYDRFNHLALDLKNDFMFWGNDKHLSQVIFNLLENSYINAPQKCNVSIWIKDNKIYYKDNGTGISPIHMPYIFDYFYSTNNSIGIGLSYAKKVIKAFKGNIICQSSTNVKKGTYTCFIVTLPKIK